jgi:acetyl esterase/lipase
MKQIGWGIALSLLWSCTGDADPTTTTIVVVPSIGTPTSASVEVEGAQMTGVVSDLPVAVYAPAEIGPYPVIVLFHGGSWFGGAPLSMAPLAEYLASEGVVVFNATYRTQTGGYPESFDDVACAVRYARTHAGEFTADPSSLAIGGHSAGAHLASVIALAGDDFGGGCSVEGSAAVDRFVGLAGPYDPTVYRALLPAFFGTRYENDPGPWEAGSAYSYLGENSAMEVLLMHGDADELVPLGSSMQFSRALAAAGYQVELVEVAGAPHQALRDPSVVGENLVDFLYGR